jgi:hypothetical protein
LVIQQLVWDVTKDLQLCHCWRKWRKPDILGHQSDCLENNGEWVGGGVWLRAPSLASLAFGLLGSSPRVPQKKPKWNKPTFAPPEFQFQLPQLFGVVGFLSQDDLISVFSCLALLMLGLLGLRFGTLQNFILQSFQTSTWIQIHFSVLFILSVQFQLFKFLYHTPPPLFWFGLGFSWRPPSSALDWSFAIYLLDVQSNFGDILSSSTFRRYVYNERHLEEISHDGGS